MRKTDMVTSGGSYRKAKGSAGISSHPKGASSASAKQVRRSNKRMGLAGWMDTRPENSDRNQSAK